MPSVRAARIVRGVGFEHAERNVFSYVGVWGRMLRRDVSIMPDLVSELNDPAVDGAPKWRPEEIGGSEYEYPSDQIFQSRHPLISRDNS